MLLKTLLIKITENGMFTLRTNDFLYVYSIKIKRNIFHQIDISDFFGRESCEKVFLYVMRENSLTPKICFLIYLTSYSLRKAHESAPLKQNLMV